MRDAVGDVHDAGQAELAARLRRVLVKGDCFGDGVRQAPQADQVGAHVGVRRLQFQGFDLAFAAGPAARQFQHARVFGGHAHGEHQLADVVQHAGEEGRGHLFLVESFVDGDAMRGRGGGDAVRPQRLEAEAAHLRHLAAGEDALAEHQRHDAVETEQGAGARHVGHRLGEAEVGRVHHLEQARRHRRIASR